ncbi:hypothetical protein CBR_g12695 [Chara braunii]|uniref:Uncharacterized protein n=1 Tax=Chara braunii TaxID=69332 RepID=A0A388KSF7_CHABU|nr:hypothetical protein CBR_g12695 [Chara braunii]|eukprot:GBG72976.1 hypothetical protein CBR_g12695 [Chara braunii]
MLRGNESSWKLETQSVEKLLHQLKDEKNLIIAEVVHDDCGAVDVILRRMDIDSQKCMWHKAKTLVKCLREAVRGTKTVKPAAVGACEHVREMKWVSTRKKDELVEIVWGVLFPDEAGKALPDDVVEIDALQTLHCNAAEEAKEWFPRVRDWARSMLQQSDVDDPVIEHYDEEADYGLPDAVESVVEGVVAEGENVFVEAGSESASDDEKSSSDSYTDGAALRLDFDGAVFSQEVSVAQK